MNDSVASLVGAQFADPRVQAAVRMFVFRAMGR